MTDDTFYKLLLGLGCLSILIVLLAPGTCERSAPPPASADVQDGQGLPEDATATTPLDATNTAL